MVLYLLGFIIFFQFAIWWETRNRFDAIENRALRIHLKLEEISKHQQRHSNYLNQVWRLVMTEYLENSTDFNGHKRSKDEIEETMDRYAHSNEGKEDHEWEGSTKEQILAISHNAEYKKRGESQ